MVASVIATDGHERAWRVVSTVTNLMLIALVVLAGFVLVFADRLVPLYTSGFDPATMARTIELTRIMVLSPILLALGAVATSVLNTRGGSPRRSSRRSSTTSRSSAPPSC